jgi:hypothetical protein
MNVAWMLGPETVTGDWELRISMRSFWMHYRSSSKPWIIGRIPAWISQEKVRCLSWPDPYRSRKDANLLHKALRLAMEPEISDPFILCSDDHLLLQSSSPEDFKLWHRGEISHLPAEGMTRWQLRMINTGMQLRKAGYPAFFFDAHIPYPLRKAWVKEVLRFDFAKKTGMCLFSTILNCCPEVGMPMKGHHVRAWLGTKGLAPRVVDSRLSKNRFACLTGESMNNDYLISRLEQLFPEPAPWELDAPAWSNLIQTSAEPELAHIEMTTASVAEK